MKSTTDQIVLAMTSARPTSDGRKELTTTPRSLLVPLVGIFAVNLLLRAFYLRYQFVNGDEAVRALTALGVLRGERLYLDVITDKPPGTTLFYAAVLSVFNHSMPAVHVAATLWTFGTAIAIYMLGARFYSRRIGLWAGFLFVYFAASYQTQDSMAANTELLMALPYVLSCYCYLRGLPGASRTPPVRGRGRISPAEMAAAVIRRSGNDWSWLIAAGFLAGMAALFKQVGLLLLVFFVINESFRAMIHSRVNSVARPARADAGEDLQASSTEGDDSSPRERWGVRASIRRLSLVAVGVALVFAGLVAWLWGSGAMSGFWRNAVQLGAFYVGSLPARMWLKFLLFRSLGYVFLTSALWLLAGLGLGPAARRLCLTVHGRTPAGSAPDPHEIGFAINDVSMTLWCLVSLAGVFSSGRFYGHYFIPALPALSLLAARGIARLREQALIPLRRRQALTLAGLVALLLAFNLVRFHHRTAILAYETISGWRTRWSQQWGMTRREENAQEVAGIIRCIDVGEGQPLYIWGYALDVYWRSGCIPASRYLTPYYVTGEFYPEVPASATLAASPFWQQARSQLLDDLRRSRPRLILNVDQPIETLPYPEIVDFMHQNYRLDGLIGSDPPYQFIVYVRKEDY